MSRPRSRSRYPDLRRSSGQASPLLLTAILALLALAQTGKCFGAEPAAVVLGPSAFESQIRPMLAEYCLKCHSAEKHKGDLDLERFSSLAEAMRQPKVWLNVVEQVGTSEMPPKDKPQPTPEQRERLLAWASALLDEAARARAGDPGPVVLRRLSNAEYTYTIRDLTGVDSLDPVREFPVDSAAGEGFMNTGNALVMSPSLLTKYLEAGKGIAAHAVLLPDGIRFSPKTTRRDWTEELLARIRDFYRGFTDPRGGDRVNLQGIVFETNEGGRLPLERYLAALLEARPALRDGSRSVDSVAHTHGLSAKYLGLLWKTLNTEQPSLLLDGIRARWREAKPGDASTLAAAIAEWQKPLWKFSSVGHIGKLGGPKAWMEPVSPISAKQEVRLKLPANPEAREVTLYLVAGDAGDGNENDFVLWQKPRLIAPGRPDLLLRDVQPMTRRLHEQRERLFATTANALRAAAEAGSARGPSDVGALASKHGVDTETLRAWLDYLGIGSAGPLKLDGHFTNTIHKASGYDFINGWGSPDTPSLMANSSDQHVRIPGNMKPHSIAVHPSPKLQAAVGWRSPINGIVRVEAAVTHAHPECGNGVTWSLEFRRGATRRRLAAGTAQGGKEIKIPTVESLAVQPDDLVSLLIGPRDGNHACDLTAVDLVLTRIDENPLQWNLARDVSPNVLAANPQPDAFGHPDVWHFYTEPDKNNSELGPVIPAGSLLAKWQSAAPDQKEKIAQEIQQLLSSGSLASGDGPDQKLYRQLASLGGPLLSGIRLTAPPNDRPRPQSPALRDGKTARNAPQEEAATDWGLDPARFGHFADGRKTDDATLALQAPAVIEVRLPADLVAGCEFVTTAVLDPDAGKEGSVQLLVLTNPPPRDSGLLPSRVTVTEANGPWTSYNRRVSHAAPIVVQEGSAARQRIEAAFDEFRQVFPAALCYTKIVPVDEVVTLTLFYREDHQLARLMLDDTQSAQLDRLWDELHYVSHDALTLVDAFEQLWQFATQDADPKVFEPLRQPINDRAAAFRRQLVDTQPKHLQAVLDFAGNAYRHPLTPAEKQELQSLYGKLRSEDLPHEEAIRLTLARVLVAPAFLYRLEKPGPGTEPGSVNNWELATRLSYFLWSSTPDSELRRVADSGKLQDPQVLAAQARRMLRDPKVRRLATEFACAWLHIYAFDELNEKSERHFPAFAELRGAIYEESRRFFTDFFQNDRPVLSLLDADYTFLNEPLAKYYGIPNVTGPEWRRVDGVKRYARGGILALASTLAKQSGASRTSPILRGNWVGEVLLGEKLPRPPKDVPRLPEDETATDGLTVRQLVEKHSSDPKCYVCHRRIDPYGYALESFDAIGRRREKDLADRPIDTHSTTLDGAPIDGLDGLRDYLLHQRRDAFVRQFCRKLLGYSLARAVQLSDGPLLAEMRAQIKNNDAGIAAAIETIVRSRPFREIRGRAAAADD